MPSVRSPPPPMRSQVLVYCCDQDHHGEPSRSPPRADCGPSSTQPGRDAGRTPSLRPTLVAPPLGHRPSPSSGGTSSSSSGSSQPASSSTGDGCSDANCADGSPSSAVFACCGLPLSSGCRPISPVTGCEVAEGCLECPDCRLPPGPCPDESTCELAQCEQLGLAVSCTSPECASAADVPCFDEDCDDDCGAVECDAANHADCPLDGTGQPVASDVLDCCGHEHSWACEDAPPLFGDFDQLLDCCPPQFADLSTGGHTAPPPVAAGPTDFTSFGGTSSDPASQQAPLSAFQALIDAAIKDQALPRHVGGGQPLQPSADGSQAASINPPPQLSLPVAATTTRPGEVPCLWTGCEEVFPNVDLLLNHFRTTASHIPFPNAPDLDQPFNAGAIQAQQLFQGAAALQLAQQQQQQQQQQASDDAKATQEILDFFSQSSAQPVPALAQPVGMPASASPSLDPFSVQCQWGGQTHTFTLADLLPPAQPGDSTNHDVSMTTDTATLSPTNLFLKHLMEDHLAGIGPSGLIPFPPQPLHVNTSTPVVSVSPGLLGDDAGSVFSASGGAALGSSEWSASTPLSSTSTAGTPTSLDSGVFAGILHAHSHPHHHPLGGFHHHHNIHQYSPLHHPQQHQFFYVPQHVHHAHLHTQLSPHVHAHTHHQHVHAHSHGPADPIFALQPPAGQQQHHCSIDPPPTASATRPSSSSSSASHLGRSASRHHPYRPPTSDVPSPASTSATGAHHSHVHHLHHKHKHTHAHSRHLLPSIKHASGRSSISSMGEVAQSQGSPIDGMDGPAVPSVHACGWPGCGLVFDDTAALTDHLDKVHVGSGKNQYSCGWEGCDRALHGPVFKSKQKIMRHLQSHTGHKPFVCPLCSQTFSEAATLQQHVRRHSTDKPHVCDYDGCAKAFPLASSLAIHKRTHDDVKPFQCPHCARCFTEASNLNKHIRTHTGEKPFVCKYPGCSKRFARPDQLSRHQGVHLRREERERAVDGGDGGSGEGSVPEDRPLSDDEQDESG